jgi:D-alanyl-lipoteichoic acid acyltransferase DltB (MBOAT superfamily)
VANLGVLGYFKYGGFLMAQWDALMLALGVAWQPAEWSVVLPVGISFFTFQSMSYTIDVYRRRIPADASLVDFALFVSFFPQLVAGPIVRASTFLPQLAAPRRATAEQLGWGLALMVAGLFAKVVMADGLLAPAVDPVWERMAIATGADAWVAVLAFSGQIYCDFAGYSVCAIGAALCLGFHLPRNFNAPYAARGFSDFWRRWHISLSSWLRDYLYIPLGGNRGGESATRRNLLLTMLIGGLWHGASWLFVLWGGLHGLFLVAERWLRARRGERPSRVPEVVAVAGVFALATLAWIPFRAPDLDSAIACVLAMLGGGQGGAPLLPPHAALAALGAMVVLLGWQWATRHRPLEATVALAPPWARLGALAGALALIGLFSGGGQSAFIYFQF